MPLFQAEPDGEPEKKELSDIRLFSVRKLADARAIVELALSGAYLIVNTEAVPEPDKQRVLDYLAGAAQALRLCLCPVCEGAWIIAPKAALLQNQQDGGETYYEIDSQ